MEPPKPLGTSIRIFLAAGEADGVWVVEKSNWTGKALMAPRTRYGDLRARPDLDGPGVYLLVGPTESGLLPSRVYIGETDDLPGRLDSHNKNKDFWNRAIVFTSKDANLNKAHIRFLEAHTHRAGQRDLRISRDLAQQAATAHLAWHAHSHRVRSSTPTQTGSMNPVIRLHQSQGPPEPLQNPA